MPRWCTTHPTWNHPVPTPSVKRSSSLGAETRWKLAARRTHLIARGNPPTSQKPWHSLPLTERHGPPRQTSSWTVDNSKPIETQRQRRPSKDVAAACGRAVNGRTTDPECCRDGAGRLAARMHPLSQSSLCVSERLWPTNGLPTCPSRIPRCTAALPAQFQLKLGETGENTSHHAASSAGGFARHPYTPQAGMFSSELE